MIDAKVNLYLHADDIDPPISITARKRIKLARCPEEGESICFTGRIGESLMEVEYVELCDDGSLNIGIDKITFARCMEEYLEELLPESGFTIECSDSDREAILNAKA